MTQRRDAVRCVLHQPVLDGGYAVAQLVGVAGFLHGKLREVADAVGDQLAAFHRVELPLLIEEVVHIHTSQLGDALLLRHLVVEFVNQLVGVNGSTAACHKC